MALHELKARIWAVLMDFMYNNEVTISDEQHGLQVLQCARRFMIDELVTVVACLLGSITTVDNANQVISTAILLECPKLKLAAVQVSGCHFSYIDPKIFQLLDFDTFSRLVSMTSLRCKANWIYPIRS